MVESSRCPWCGTDPQYVAYHDEEWGVPVRDDVALFNTRLKVNGVPNDVKRNILRDAELKRVMNGNGAVVRSVD